jgi:erythromycin esterase
MKKTFFLILSIILGNITLLSQVNPVWQQWIKNNSYELSISDTIHFHDLDFLKQVLKDKKIVFLGENSHGVSEFTLLKSRLIRYLHAELGFNVLAFESNAGDAFASNLIIPFTSGLNSIYNSISTMWHVKEIVTLFNYIRETHNTKNPLNVAGVDITMSNGSYSFSNFLYNLISLIDPTYAREIQKSDSIFSRIGVLGWTGLLSNEEKASFKTMRNNQISVYTNCINFINKNNATFPHSKGQNVEAAKFYLQSRIDFIYWYNRDSTFMANKLQLNDSKMNLIQLFANFRDFMMSQNLKFLTTTLYPSEKIIVWAEDAHIKKRIYRMPTDSSYSGLTYTIGLFCYSGKGCYTY